MKILFVSENYPPHIEGGTEISTSLLAEWLAQKGHEVQIIASKFTDKNYIQNGVRVFPLFVKAELGKKGIWSAFSYAINIIIAPVRSSLAILRHIRKHNPDVVNVVVTLYYFIPIVLFIHAFTNKRIIVEAHDYSMICPAQFKNNELLDPLEHTHGYRCLKDAYQPANRFLQLFAHVFARYESFIFNVYKSWLRNLMNRSDRVVLTPNSDYVGEQFISNGFNAESIVTIYNMSKPVEITSTQSAASIPTFVYGGRIEKEKGIWDLIEAIENLHKENIGPFAVDIAGSGSEFEAITKYIASKKELPITVHGHISSDDLMGLYQRSVAIIAPSRWPEPFGRFIQEAAAIGKPVIATRAGGIPEGVEDGINGKLIAIGDVASLTSAMRYFLVDADASVRMGQEMRKKSVLFDEDIIGNKRLAVYK